MRECLPLGYDLLKPRYSKYDWRIGRCDEPPAVGSDIQAPRRSRCAPCRRAVAARPDPRALAARPDPRAVRANLGAFGHIDQTVAWRSRDGYYGGEDRELDNADREPSLGSLGGVDQTAWASGGARDVEDDPAESGIGDWEGLMEQCPSWWHGLAE